MIAAAQWPPGYSLRLKPRKPALGILVYYVALKAREEFFDYH